MQQSAPLVPPSLPRLAPTALLAAAALLSPATSSRAAPSPPPPTFANDTSLAQLPGTDLIVLASEDESGAIELAPDGSRSKKAHPSWAGVSLSRDRGRTWEKQAPIAPDKVGCSEGLCALSLLGAPRVIADDDGPRITYATLARTSEKAEGTGGADAIAVTQTFDGKSWTPLRIAARMDEGISEPFSLDSGNQSFSVAFATTLTGRLFIAYDDYVDHVIAPFKGPDEIALPRPGLVRNPILRLTDAYSGFLAYMQPHDAMSSSFDLTVAHVTRLKLVGAGPGVPAHYIAVPWFVDDVVLLRNNVQIDPLVAGALDRPFRDASPMSFELSNFGRRMHLAYRTVGPDLPGSRVVVYSCDSERDYCLSDAPLGTWDGWFRQVIDDCSAHGGQYQPSLVTRREGDDVGITFYQRMTADPADLRVELMGARSVSGGYSFTKPRPVQPTPFIPCPDAYGPSFAPHRFGDYVGGLALSSASTATKGPPTFLTAHPMSTTCVDAHESTDDQHVEVVSW